MPPPPGSLLGPLVLPTNPDSKSFLWAPVLASNQYFSHGYIYPVISLPLPQLEHLESKDVCASVFLAPSTERGM